MLTKFTCRIAGAAGTTALIAAAALALNAGVANATPATGTTVSKCEQIARNYQNDTNGQDNAIPDPRVKLFFKLAVQGDKTDYHKAGCKGDIRVVQE